MEFLTLIDYLRGSLEPEAEAPEWADLCTAFRAIFPKDVLPAGSEIEPGQLVSLMNIDWADFALICLSWAASAAPAYFDVKTREAILKCIWAFWHREPLPVVAKPRPDIRIDVSAIRKADVVEEDKNAEAVVIKFDDDTVRTVTKWEIGGWLPTLAQRVIVWLDPAGRIIELVSLEPTRTSLGVGERECIVETYNPIFGYGTVKDISKGTKLLIDVKQFSSDLRDRSITTGLRVTVTLIASGKSRKVGLVDLTPAVIPSGPP